MKKCFWRHAWLFALALTLIAGPAAAQTTTDVTTKFDDASTAPIDGCGHGTHVAGVPKGHQIDSNLDANGQVVRWGKRIIFGDRFISGDAAFVHMNRWDDNTVWGLDALLDNIVWGNTSVADNIVWGLTSMNVLTGEPGFTSAEWGFAMGSPFWGSGIFVEGARLILDFAFDVVGAQRLEARAAVANGRGNGALRKMGAVQEGLLRRSFLRHGHFHDQVLWGILADDWRLQRVAERPTVTH